MGTQLTVRDVSDDVVRALQDEADERGQSMNAIVRLALERFADDRRRRKRIEASMKSAAALRRKVAEEVGGYLSDSSELIREDRDR